MTAVDLGFPALADAARPWVATRQPKVSNRHYERLYRYGPHAVVVTEYWTGQRWQRHPWNRASVCDNQELPWRALPCRR